MSREILFVDDEPQVLEGYKRVLHGDFEIAIAVGGPQAIAKLERDGPCAVVVSDMRMPGMNGIQLLSRVREIAPQTVRVVLTGHTDIETAINAVNENSIFRFLTKPCAAPVLKATLTTCLLQYQMVTGETELLENTLMGSIKVLTDLLSLANPTAFGRSLRIKRYVHHMVQELRLESSWRHEAAAMLSQLGCVTLEPQLLEAAYCGKPLLPEEQASFDMHPAVARDLLGNIPRLEGIAWIVSQQLEAACVDNKISDGIKTGAVILQIAVALDELKGQGLSDLQAIAYLEANHKVDERVIQALKTLPPATLEMEARAVAIGDLEPGMIMHEELCNPGARGAN